MAVTCIIEFDNNPYGTFLAGQVLTGKVTLKLEKLKLVKAVTLNINGYAETQWRENHGAGKRRTRDTYRAREDYIASQTYLAGSNLSTEVSLEPGIHVYNFTCQIPATCPSSIEGQFGRVRYMTKVSLVRPWKFDQSYTRCFTVLRLMDLNYNGPLLRMPTQVNTQKTYCCWPCQSEPLQLQLTLAQSGFVPGQTIPISILATNDSHIRVESMEIRLVMLVTYHAHHMSRTSAKNERFVVTKMMGDSVLNHCKKQFDYLLRVPATPPSCLDGLCRIIQITYQVELEAKVKGCHNNELLKVSITVGSIPLSDHMQIQPRDLPGQQPLDAAALGYSASAPPAADTNSPWAIDGLHQLPNYEEAVHMRTQGDFDKTDGAEESAPDHTVSLDGRAFSPLYPIFDIPSPSAPEELKSNSQDAAKGTWL